MSIEDDLRALNNQEELDDLFELVKDPSVTPHRVLLSVFEVMRKVAKKNVMTIALIEKNYSTSKLNSEEISRIKQKYNEQFQRINEGYERLKSKDVLVDKVEEEIEKRDDKTYQVKKKKLEMTASQFRLIIVFISLATAIAFMYKTLFG